MMPLTFSRLLPSIALALAGATCLGAAHAERPGASFRSGIGAPVPGGYFQPIPHPHPVQPIGGRASGRGSDNPGVVFGPIGAPRPGGYVDPQARTGVPMPPSGYRGRSGR